MIPAAFDYHRPKSVAEAIALLSQHGPDSRAVAGGHSLIPMMKLRLAAPTHLIDIGGLAELRGVTVAADMVTIGATVTQAEVIGSVELAQVLPILKETSQQIADPQIRSVGTIGGNVANGDPGNDMPAVMMALDASFRLTGPGGVRKVKARDFYQGPFMTSLKADELLTAIEIPRPASKHGYSYHKLKRKVGDYATAAAAVVMTVAGGKVQTCAIALTNLAPTPLYAEQAAKAVIGTSLDGAALVAAAGAAGNLMSPSPDGRGTALFRSAAGGMMLVRALNVAFQRASA
jgi:aerobic carbon-monoxide dehydrogenase medium subunit